MSDAAISTFSEKILKKGEMSAANLLKLRRMAGADFEISYDEADILFALNNGVKNTPEDWPGYFITVITNFLIHKRSPKATLAI